MTKSEECLYCINSSYTRYDEEYDANYCVVCGKWLTPCCDDPDCEYCADRPETAPGARETE